MEQKIKNLEKQVLFLKIVLAIAFLPIVAIAIYSFGDKIVTTKLLG
jgi:hypothetical protein